MTHLELERQMEDMLLRAIPRMSMSRPPWRRDALTCWLGSIATLDPCGREHEDISSDGAPLRCRVYWTALRTAADTLGGWLEEQRGSIYFALPAAADGHVHKEEPQCTG